MWCPHGFTLKTSSFLSDTLHHKKQACTQEKWFYRFLACLEQVEVLQQVHGDGVDHQLGSPPHALWLLLLCNKQPCLTAIKHAVSHGPAVLSPAAPQLTSVPPPAGKPELEAVLLPHWPLLYSVARAVVIEPLCPGQGTAAAAGLWSSPSAGEPELEAVLLSY